MRPQPALRLGLAGLGTVGGGVLTLLHKNREMITARAGRPIEVVAASMKDLSKDRAHLPLSGVELVPDARALATLPQVDAVVEVMGGHNGIARDTALAALDSSKPLITANKALLAHHGLELANKAELSGVPLLWEAAVMAGVPVVQALRDGLAALTISKISGVMNGTCAFILSTMASTGRTFDDVLAEAKSLGYLEADPRLDIDGIDTAHKLVLLSAVAFGQAPNLDKARISGISSITPEKLEAARKDGLVYRLIATAAPSSCTVSLQTVPLASPLGQLQGTQNAVLVETEEAGSYFFQGAGAGAHQTATGILSDTISLAQGRPARCVFGRPAAQLES